MRQPGGDPSPDDDVWESGASDGRVALVFTWLWGVAAVERRIEVREGLMLWYYAGMDRAHTMVVSQR